MKSESSYFWNECPVKWMCVKYQEIRSVKDSCSSDISDKSIIVDSLNSWQQLFPTESFITNCITICCLLLLIYFSYIFSENDRLIRTGCDIITNLILWFFSSNSCDIFLYLIIIYALENMSIDNNSTSTYVSYNSLI